VESADFLGQKKVTKRSWGFSNGMNSRNYFEQEEHKLKPYALRHLRKHHYVLVHCEGGFKQTLLPPLEPDGSVAKWFKRLWLSMLFWSLDPRGPRTCLRARICYRHTAILSTFGTFAGRAPENRPFAELTWPGVGG